MLRVQGCRARALLTTARTSDALHPLQAGVEQRIAGSASLAAILNQLGRVEERARRHRPNPHRVSVRAVDWLICGAEPVLMALRVSDAYNDVHLYTGPPLRTLASDDFEDAGLRTRMLVLRRCGPDVAGSAYDGNRA